MTYTIVTSTLAKVKSKKGGVTRYTVSAQLFNGVVDVNENGRTIQRISLGCPVDLATLPAKDATALIKRLRAAGNVIEVG